MTPVTRIPDLTDEAQAVLIAAILAVRVDGRLETAELARLRSMFHLSPLFSRVEDVDATIQDAAAPLAGRGESEILEDLAATLPRHLAETAYAWAAALVRSDGIVVREEHAYLDRLRRALHVDGRLAGKIKAVLEILDRGA